MELLGALEPRLRAAERAPSGPATGAEVHGVGLVVADTDELFAAVVSSWDVDG